MNQDLTPKRWLDRLLHLHDTPRRTAAAFSLGVFFSFSPFIGLQILLSFALAFLFRLNRLAVFIGLNANLPWFIAPWYAGTTLLAAYVLGVAVPAEFGSEIARIFGLGILSRAFWSELWALVRPFLVPYLVGPTIGAAVIGAATYPVTRALLERRTLLRQREQ